MTKYTVKICITCNEDKKTRMASATVESTQTLDTLLDRITKVDSLGQIITATKAKRLDGRFLQAEAVRARHAAGLMKPKPAPAKVLAKPAKVLAKPAPAKPALKPAKVLAKPVTAPVRIKHQPSMDRVVDMRRKRD
jgi:hypothetical protein